MMEAHEFKGEKFTNYKQELVRPAQVVNGVIDFGKTPEQKLTGVYLFEIENKKDIVVYTRNAYTLFQMASDIGGLSPAFFGFAGILLLIIRQDPGDKFKAKMIRA